MVAQFLRLKLQLLANVFRRSPGQAIGIALGLIYGLGVALLIAGALVLLRAVDDVALVRSIVVILGSAIIAGFTVLPLFFGADDSMDPRKFALFGLPNRTLSFSLALAGLVGVPGLLIAAVAAASVVTWSRNPGGALLAIIAGALIVATCILFSRVVTSVAAFLLSTRRARDLTGLLGFFALIMISPVIVVLTTLDWTSNGPALLGAIADILGWTPWGAAWSVPADAAVGQWGTALLKLVIAMATVALLWLAWQKLVARMLVTSDRQPTSKSYGGLGWFDLLPGTVFGAIASRSVTYWVRDPRYLLSLIIIPIVPFIMLVPLTVAGVPAGALALMPLPVMCLFLGWTMHNDVAYDHTAIWVHVVSGRHGLADRLGRVFPVLLVGIPLIAIGSWVTVLMYGESAILPSVLGVSTCLLLGGIGLSSYVSARFPYPAPKPGDSPFNQPQGTGMMSATVQAVTFMGSLLLTLPAVIFAGLGLFVSPSWHLASLLSGLGIGLVAAVVGVVWGARVFDRRGPEIMASALRA